LFQVKWRKASIPAAKTLDDLPNKEIEGLKQVPILKMEQLPTSVPGISQTVAVSPAVVKSIFNQQIKHRDCNLQEQEAVVTEAEKISDAPLKLLNAADPKILNLAAAEAHKLDLSKVPGYYLGLSKSRLTGLVVVTAMAGYALGPAAFSMVPFASLTVGTALTSASANTINQIMEVPFDSQMDRTKNRVLVKNQLRSVIYFLGLTRFLLNPQ